jgi:C-terminal processing protease CtpA/Prc
MSGLYIHIPVPDEHQYIIAGIREQSRAELAGIKPGDEILSINGTPASRLNLHEIYKSLHGNQGKKIRMELLRKDERIRANFRLEKYI